MFYPIEVPLERIHVSGPEAAERSQPRIQLLKWFRFQPVESTLCVHGGLHETGLAKHAQVFGYGRLRHPQLTLDRSNRLLRRHQQAQYCAPVWFGDDFEDGFHALDIPHVVYARQGI